MINTVYFEKGSNFANVYNLYQWDYGQSLEIKGLDIHGDVWVQFAMNPYGGEAIPVVTKVNDGVITANIPAFVFEKETSQNYNAYAFVYVSNADSGETVKVIKLNIKARPKPEDYVYTEPEKKRYELLEERVKELEENGVPGGPSQDDTSPIDPRRIPDMYYKESAIVEILPETNTQSNDEQEFLIPAFVELEVGKEYTIVYNGNTYLSKAQEFHVEDITVVILGNGSHLGLDGNDEPFAIAIMESVLSGIDFSGAKDITIAIYDGTEKINTIKDEYFGFDWLPKEKENKVEIFKKQVINVTNANSFGEYYGFDLGLDQETRKKIVNKYDSLTLMLDGVNVKLSHVKRLEEDGVVYSAIYTAIPYDELRIDHEGTVMIDMGKNGTAQILLTIGEHELEVSHVEKSIEKIPKKFIPDYVLTDEKVDSELSKESLNPVKNKVVAEAVEKLYEEIVDLKESGTGATAEQIQQIETNKNNIETLSKVKSDKSELVKEVADRKQSVETEKIERQAEIAVERARVDALTRLNEGSTTGDAELIDARIDADGITHDNVGNAIRTQGAKINDLSRLILPTMLYKGEATYKGGWIDLTVANNLYFQAGKSYTASIELDEIPTSSTYFQIRRADATNINQIQLNGLQGGFLTIEPLYNEEGCYINLASDSYKGRCIITVYENESDSIEKLSECIEQIEDGYKNFEGVFVHGYNYGSFDKTDKYKAVSVQTYAFDHDVMIKCDYGYAFLISYFDENGQYLSSGTWVEHGEEYVVQANSIFRINIENKDISVVVDPAEVRLKAQYATKIESKLSGIERKISEVERRTENVDSELRKFNPSDFEIGERYDYFDKTVKTKVTNINSFTFDYDLMITGCKGYRYLVLIYDENDKYKTYSGWKEESESYVVPSGEPFRVSIEKVQLEDVSDVAEYVNGVSYLTKIGSEVGIKFPELEKRVSEIERTEGNGDSEARKFDSDEFKIGERYNNFDTSVKTKVTNVNSFVFNYDVAITCDEGYTFLVLTYDENDKYKTYSGWKVANESYVVPSGKPFRISIEKVPVETVSNIAEYVEAISYFTEIGSKVNVLEDSVKEKLENLNLVHIMRKNKYFSHIDVDYYNGLIIPSQSVFDVQRSRRLGFKVMEINVRTTSDGVFYAFHGEANCFGSAFESVDGADISGVNVSTVTSDYIQSNVRYKSKYAKYRTAPSTVRDVLIECKKNEIIPLIQYAEGIVEFTKAIMGENLFFLGIYERDRGNSDCGDCICVSWMKGTASQFITKAQKSGGAYFCGVNVTDSMYAGYSESDWGNFIDEIHKAGYFVNCAYQKQNQVQKLLNAGIDMMASHGEINDFEHGNMFDSVSDLDYADFTTNGNVSEGVLTLTSGQTVTPKNITESVFLGGASLHVLHKGKIRVKMGIVDDEFESDGKKSMWFSSFVQEAIPTFLITAVGDTEILEISFKASKM